MMKNLHKIKFTKVLEGTFRGTFTIATLNKGYFSRAAICVNTLENATREGM